MTLMHVYDNRYAMSQCVTTLLERRYEAIPANVKRLLAAISVAAL